MCKAIEDMLKEAAEEAVKEVEHKERIATRLTIIKNLIQNIGWPVKQSMDMLGIPEEERMLLSKLLN